MFAVSNQRMITAALPLTSLAALAVALPREPPSSIDDISLTDTCQGGRAHSCHGNGPQAGGSLLQAGSLSSSFAAARYSDESQDEWVLSELGHASEDRPLRFLDIGARDGDFFSNTRRLEENGWAGTCIEPFPTKFKKYHRTCNLIQKALVAQKDQMRIYSNCEDGSGITGWSGFTATNKNDKDHISGCTQTEVPQTTFAELGLPQALDYISLDVEGVELELLKSFPFDTHCSKLWTVEGAGLEYAASVSEPIVQILAQHGCMRVKQTKSDGFFKCSCS